MVFEDFSTSYADTPRGFELITNRKLPEKHKLVRPFTVQSDDVIKKVMHWIECAMHSPIGNSEQR